MQLNPLQPNDLVALACPGSICLSANHPELAQNYLRQHYQLDACFNNHTITFEPAKKRAEILLDYLFDNKIKAIFALRGGEGSADLIPELHQHQAALAKLKPKWLLGFSDITALLIYFAQEYRWPTLHASSPLSFALNHADKNSEKITMDLLFGKENKLSLSELTPLNPAAFQPTTFTAKLTGGCLSLVDISIKDLWEIDTKDKIIFLEDVGEKAHKIIRNLKYFSRIGVFSGAKAVILGDFTCQPIGNNQQEQANNQQAILNALSYFASLHSFPILHTTQFGHGKINLPLMYCQTYQLILGEKASLNIIK